MNKFRTYKLLKLLSITLLVVIGLNAVLAGYSLMKERDGSGLGMTTGLLTPSPFIDFFIPGLILFFLPGVVSLLVAFLTLRNHFLYPYLVWLQGCMIIGWIIIQVEMIRTFHVMQVIVGSAGVFLVITGFALMKLVKNTPHSSRQSSR